MSRPLKVWGGLMMLTVAQADSVGMKNYAHKQVRAICATTSQKRAAELLDTTLGEIRGWWCTTGNAVELAVATEEGVWVAPQFSRETAAYKRLRVSR